MTKYRKECDLCGEIVSGGGRFSSVTIGDAMRGHITQFHPEAVALMEKQNKLFDKVMLPLRMACENKEKNLAKKYARRNAADFFNEMVLR